ncbi:MAG: DNA polymerase III subunit delta' [Anaerolineales bacterium]|nr:DNA polymerase III subunit delta' [Anaerolineales bacterium]
MDWNILGHEWAVDLLKQQIAGGRVRHAYLFSGPEGVGRRMLALRLAQALNCPNPPQPGQPCLTCSTCTRLERMQHPDLMVIQPDEGSRVIKVEQVREVQHNLALAPYEARYKIALFLNFQDAHTSVPNAMLKTLEEPPPQVIIMLTADDPDNLLPTITSRCEVLRLRPLAAEAVAEGLQSQWGIPAEQASLLAHVTGGLPARAVQLNEQPELLEQRSQWLEDFCGLLNASRTDKFAFAMRAVKEDKESIPAELQVWISLWRDVVLRSAGSSVPLVNVDWAAQVSGLAAQVGFEQACRTLSLMNQALEKIEHSNINLQLALETMLLEFPHLRLSN